LFFKQSELLKKSNDKPVKNATKRTFEPESLLASIETTSKISKMRQSRMEPAAIFAPKKTPQVVNTEGTSALEANTNSTRHSNNRLGVNNTNMNESQEDCVNLKIDVSLIRKKIEFFSQSLFTIVCLVGKLFV